MVSPPRAPGVSTLDFITMIGLAALLLPLLCTGRLLHRLEGVALLALQALDSFVRWPQ